GNGLVEHEVKRLDRRYGLALENNASAKRFHAENAEILLQSRREHLLSEAAEMSIHNVVREHDGVELKAVVMSNLQHAEVNRRVFVPGKPDIPQLARLLRIEEGVDGSVIVENAIRVLHSNHFMELQQVDVVG